MKFRLGVDIGGTFTDIVAAGDDGQTLRIGKVLTTAAPDDGVIEGVRQLLRDSAIPPGDADQFIHGTTLFTNALIQRQGARTALITTRGFRDALEIAREHRFDMYDLQMARPEALVPRHLRFEIGERVLADGSVRQPVSAAEIRELAGRLKAEQVEAVAVCLLHSYANPAHEQEVGSVLARELPGLAVTLSSELVPEIREYDRASTTVANVYVRNIAEQYLGRLKHRLAQELRLDCSAFVMQSNGGVCEIETAQQYPIKLVESGPAGGALAAAHYGKLTGHPDLLSFDMGGTTAKACMIVGGEPVIAREFEIDRRYQFKKGSGLPVKVPVIEMIEIGTGGGSIARVDAMRRMQVGPRSAGSAPGPACYRLGGTQPTVTDADLLLGYLDPGFFLGGKMALDVEAAAAAVREAIASPLGLGVSEAAWGVHNLANESMASAARIHAIERGKDISRFPVFAFGGAGPVHAYGVAKILRSRRVIYPLGAGVMSAVGFLAAPLGLDFVHSRVSTLDDTDWNDAERIVVEMEQRGRDVLSRTIPAASIWFRRSIDMRYRNQGYEIRVPAPDGPLGAGALEVIRSNFESEYVALYGHTVPSTPIDIVSWRVIAYGPKPDLRLPTVASGAGLEGSALKRTRRIYLPAERAAREVPVYDRYALGVGSRIQGPAIIEERESTVVVNGPADIQVDQWGNLIADL